MAGERDGRKPNRVRVTCNMTFPSAALEPCSIYVHDVHAAHNMHIPADEVPAGWEHGQYATELWVQRALQGHPWRVPSAQAADLIFVAANFSLYCVVSMYKQRALWSQMTRDRFLYPDGPSARVNRSQPSKFVTLQYQGCKPPWQQSRKPADITLLKEYTGDPRRTVVSPFVVSRPPWLVGSDATRQSGRSAASKPASVSWDSRKLAFFAGHVPKPYIRATRYLMWRQGRRDARVTVISSTLKCQVGSFATCSKPLAFLQAQNNSFWLTHCHPLCGTTSTCMSSARRKPAANMAGFLRACTKMHGPRQMSNVNFTEELPDMIRDSRRVPHAEYLTLAMTHRFCLIAPGDWVSTHKVTEAMALGGAGGCIPVFIAPGRSLLDLEQAVPGMLPYTRWHDYCSTSYFISEYDVKLNFTAALDRLAVIGEAEASNKLAALRRVQDAFVFRHDATLQRPSAPHFILAEACAAASRFRGANTSGSGGKPVKSPKARVDLGSCYLEVTRA